MEFTTEQLDEMVARLLAEDEALLQGDKRFSDARFDDYFGPGYLRDVVRRIVTGH